MKELAKRLAAAVIAGSLASGASASARGFGSFNAPVTEGAKGGALEIAGAEVSSENAADILGNGVFSYDEATATLTINGDYENRELDTILINAKAPLNIVVAKDSRISLPEATFLRSVADVNMTGDGKLTLCCLDGLEFERGADLTISYADIDIASYFAAFSIFRESQTSVGAQSRLTIEFSNVFVTSESEDVDYSVISGFDESYYRLSSISEPKKYKFENHQIRAMDGSRVTAVKTKPSFVPGDVDYDGKFTLADAVAVFRAIVKGVSADKKYVEAVGDVYNTGDGLTFEDFTTIYAWVENGNKPYYGAIPVLSFDVDEEKGVFSNIKHTGEYLHTSRSSLRGAYLSLVGEPDEPVDGVWGDVCGDGEVKMNDVVLIMQSVSNADKYGLEGTDEHRITAKGQYYGDVDSFGNGVTPKDALRIQQYLVKLADTLEPQTE